MRIEIIENLDLYTFPVIDKQFTQEEILSGEFFTKYNAVLGQKDFVAVDKQSNEKFLIYFQDEKNYTILTKFIEPEAIDFEELVKSSRNTLEQLKFIPEEFVKKFDLFNTRYVAINFSNKKTYEVLFSELYINIMFKFTRVLSYCAVAASEISFLLNNKILLLDYLNEQGLKEVKNICLEYFDYCFEEAFNAGEDHLFESCGTTSFSLKQDLNYKENLKILLDALFK